MVGGPRVGDAFGELLRRAYETGGRPHTVFEVIERDDGHVRVNDASRYLTPSWGVLDEWVYERVRGRTLDVGSGAGRHAVTLQERGVPVVGLDPSEGAIEVSRRRGLRDAVVGTVVDVDPSERFDTLLMLGNNIGLLGGRDLGVTLLERLAALAAGPDAQLLATGVGREPGSVDDDEDRAYVESNLARGRLRWQVTMRSRYADLTTDWFDYVFLRIDELQELIAPTPWRVRSQLADGQAYAVQLELRRC
jgi:SAM-dependent methyltransferase